MMRGKATSKRTEYFIANHHTATIIFPRSGQGAIRLPPLILPPGKSVVMSAEDWNRLKTNRGVMGYINAGLISEVSKEGDVPMSSVTTSELIIPEHLKRDEELGRQTDIKASVRRKKATTLSID